MTAFNRAGKSSGRTYSSSRNSRDSRKNDSFKKNDSDRPYRKRDSDTDNPSDEKRTTGRRPYRKHEGDSEKKYDNRRSSETRKPYRKREGDSENKSEDRRTSGSRPYRKREGDSEKKYDNRRSSETRKPYRKREGDSEKRNDDSRSTDRRKPFRKREGDSEKKYSDRKPFRKHDGENDKRNDDRRKPYRKRDGESDDNTGRSYRKKEYGSDSHRSEKTSGYRRKEYSEDRKHGDRKSYRPEKNFRKEKSRSAYDGLNEKKESDLIRLNRYLASSGSCSRRQADEFIKLGLVSVNGTTVTEMGIKVKPGDVVKLNGETVHPEAKVYILMNKPKDYITTTDDPQERKIVTDLLEGSLRARVFPVGRLDRNTTGVLLLTNDGDLARKLMHPSMNKKKIYHVFLDKNLKTMHVEQLLEGIELEDGIIKADAVQYAHETDKSQIGVELHSGKYHIIKRMFEFLGYNVIKLDRVYFAGLTKKGLERGHWRHLSEKEVNMLKIGAFE